MGRVILAANDGDAQPLSEAVGFGGGDDLFFDKQNDELRERAECLPLILRECWDWVWFNSLHVDSPLLSGSK